MYSWFRYYMSFIVCVLNLCAADLMYMKDIRDTYEYKHICT